MLTTEQGWIDHCWEFVAALGKTREWLEHPVLKKLCKNAKDNGYTHPGFYLWVSGLMWVLYALVLRKEDEAGKKGLQPPPPSLGMLSFISGGGLASALRAVPVCPS